MVGAQLASARLSRRSWSLVDRNSNRAIQMMNEEYPEMLRQSNEVRTQATERLFLAVVNQAISDVLENGKQAKEAERWLLSKDFDALDRLFAFPAKPVSGIAISKRESAKRLRPDEEAIGETAPSSCFRHSVHFGNQSDWIKVHERPSRRQLPALSSPGSASLLGTSSFHRRRYPLK